MKDLYDVDYFHDTDEKISLTIIKLSFYKEQNKYGLDYLKYKEVEVVDVFCSYKNYKHEKYPFKILKEELICINKDPNISDNILLSYKKAEKIILLELKSSKNIIKKENLVKLLNKIRRKRKEHVKIINY